MTRKWYSVPYFIWAAAFIVAPLILVVYYAFTTGPDGSLVFSLESIAKVFQPTYLDVLLRSLLLAVIATAICLILGYPLAYILARLSPRYSRIMLILCILPMWINFLLRTYAWKTLLDNNGLLNGLFKLIGLGQVQMLYDVGAVILGLVYNFLPFMVLPIYTVLTKIQKNLVEAAQDLGAGNFTVFRKVTLPLSIPGIVSGLTMVFMPAVTTFAISRLLGGSQFQMYGDVIEQQFTFTRDWSFGSALSLIMMILILAGMALLRRYDKDSQGGVVW
jgi:spermidine/putrescine transport system permease protein